MGVRFRLLEVLSLVVAADRHRESEADDQAEQGQRGGLDDGELIVVGGLDRTPYTLRGDAEQGGDDEPKERDDEQQERPADELRHDSVSSKPAPRKA
jgi:hypothetical protein